MKAVFVELPPFAMYRGDYLDDESFRLLQDYLMQRPDAPWLCEKKVHSPFGS